MHQPGSSVPVSDSAQVVPAAHMPSGLRVAIQDLSIVVAFFTTILALQLGVGTLLGYDAFYHVRAADLYLRGEVQAAGDFFHWTQHSIWNGWYTDKDYLWHLFLAALVAIFGSDAQGLVLAGTVGTAIASTLIGLALLRIMRANGVRWPVLWTLVMLVASDTILWRLSLCRSYLLSVLLCLVGWQLLARASIAQLHMSGRRVPTWGWRCALVGLAVVYTLAYTAPHLLLGLALLWGMIEWFGGPESGETRTALVRRALVPACLVALGIAVGVLLHPHSLNTLRMWVVQNMVVPLHSYGASDAAAYIGNALGLDTIVAGDPAVADLGRELESPSGRMLVSGHIVGLILLVLPWVVLSACMTRPTRTAAFAAACSAVFFAMFMLSERFAEYFFPFVALSGAILLSEAWRSPNARALAFRRPRLVRVTAVLLVVVVLGGAVLRPVFLGQRTTPRDLEPIRTSLEAVRRHVPRGAAIFHVHWDDFPALFFYAPEYDYVVGLDPTFMYVKSPELYATYLAMKRGEEIKRGEEMSAKGESLRYEDVVRDQFHMRHVLVFPERHPDFALAFQRAQIGGRVELIEGARDDRWRLYWIKDPIKARTK